MQQRKVTQTSALFQKCFCSGDRAMRRMGMSQVEPVGSTVTLLFRKLCSSSSRIIETQERRHKTILNSLMYTHFMSYQPLL